jgi:hypothetical protein
MQKPDTPSRKDNMPSSTEHLQQEKQTPIPPHQPTKWQSSLLQLGETKAHRLLKLPE